MAQVNYSENGLVLITKSTFSAVASVSIDNCFSADYSQYKLVADFVASTDGEVRFVFRENGTPYTTVGGYTDQFVNASSTTQSAARSTTNPGWSNFPIHGRSAQKDIANAEILNPYQSTYASGFRTTSYNSSGSGTIQWQGRVYGTTVTTAFDGFELNTTVGGQTITGSIYIYGYKKS